MNLSSLADRLRLMADSLDEGETRMLICEPSNAPGLLAILSHLKLDNRFTVRPSKACLSGKLFVVNEEALGVAIHNALVSGPGIVVHPPKETP